MVKPHILLAVVALSLGLLGSLSSVAHADIDAEPVGAKAPPPADLAVLPHDVDLYQRYERDSRSLTAPPETIAKQNGEVFAELAKWSARTNSRTQEIDMQQANEIMRASMDNYVAGKKSVKTYDPEGNIGFCFGRAMWMHLELLKRGFDKKSVFKAFVVGQQEYEGVFWQFHVATIVKSKGGGFLVLDPEFMMVTRLEDWFQHNLRLSTDKKLRLYVTDPAKFGASAEKYSKDALNDDWYNNYFRDMMGYFRDQANRIAKTPLGVPEGAGAAAVAGVRAPVCRELFTN